MKIDRTISSNPMRTVADIDCECFDGLMTNPRALVVATIRAMFVYAERIQIDRVRVEGCNVSWEGGVRYGGLG